MIERIPLKVVAEKINEKAGFSTAELTTHTQAEAPARPTEASSEDGRFTVPQHVDDWDEYFMWIATVVAIKSKDPRCCVGAVIVSADHNVISTGFNGLARGVYDDARILEDADEKLKVVCHAEQNAIWNATRKGESPQGASIYVTKFPCVICCNAIIQSGISRIYTHDNKFWDDDAFDRDHSRKKDMLHQAGIQVVAPYHPEYMPKECINPKLKKGPARAASQSAPPEGKAQQK